eukprot:m.157488 g.157488  ORF g.157488 m.157488 type:complete len:246 (-) comp17005_c3_seq4:579-1316(-)
MFDAIIRGLTCVSFLPRLLLLLALGCGIGTFFLCMHLAHDHLAGQDYPSLTTLGDQDPEHVVFGAGVTVTVLLVDLIMLLAWASMRARIDEAPHTTSHNGEGRHTMNMLVLGFGVGISFFLILGAWIPHSFSSFNYVLVAGWFLGHLVYQAMYMGARLLVFCLGPGLRNAHTADVLRFLFFFACFVAEIVTAAIWMTQHTHDNRLEYAFVGLLLVFPLGNWPEFGNIAQIRSCLDNHAIGYIQMA